MNIYLGSAHFSWSGRLGPSDEVPGLLDDLVQAVLRLVEGGEVQLRVIPADDLPGEVDGAPQGPGVRLGVASPSPTESEIFNN